jgi:primosomal protein N' (replication factor Y)
MSKFVDVAVPVGVRKTFAYSVPRKFRDRIAAGMRVLVPFGRKTLTGYIVGTLKAAQVSGIKLRPIHELLESKPSITPSLVKTALWVAEHYFAPPGEVFRTLFPAGTLIAGERKVSLSPRAAKLLEGGLKPTALQPQEELILDLLVREKSLTVKDLKKRSRLRNAGNWIESLAGSEWLQFDTFLETPRVKKKEQLGVRLLDAGKDALSSLPEAQKRLLSVIGSSDRTVLLQDALRNSKTSRTVARSLERKGIVEIMPVKIDRVPVDLLATQAGKALTPTASQQRLVEEILQLIGRDEASRCLIYGVTGSGKTEVYLHLITEVLKRGETALFLVPEIGLTPLLSRLVVSRFPNQVSLMHSGMSSGERFDQWNRIRNGSSRVVVGTRSAVFAPLKDPKLIVIDEEQDASYKQDESPCYHAREVAWRRILDSGGVLVMGSATPSIETFHLASQKKGTHYFCLPERIDSKPLPHVTIVDMGQEFQRHGKTRVISQTMQEELEDCMRRGEQAIVLLNRRGYSRTLLCRSCGHVFTCPECSISMTYHQGDNHLTCHYCGREKQTPSLCANCGGAYIHYAGVGTEQLEEMLHSLLPSARIARLDRDSTRRRGTLRSTLLDFAARKLDLMVGTQMLAKGHDFPNVTMVGVIAADAGLSFPDFRSAERTFQLLIQVAGRAGRGAAPGRVVIQAYYPDNYALQYARQQDYEGFYRREIDFRKLMGYPPFRNLIQILISDPDFSKASADAEKIAAELKRQAANSGANPKPRVLGPASAPLERLRGQYRMQILIKASPGSSAVAMLRNCFAALKRKKISSKIHIDVDPLSLL